MSDRTHDLTERSMPPRGKRLSNTMYVEADQLDALRAISLATRIPVARLIRIGIDLVLDQHAPAPSAGQTPSPTA